MSDEFILCVGDTRFLLDLDEAMHIATVAELHDVLHHKLALDANQEARLAVLEQRFAVQRRAFELELRADNARLAEAIETEHGNGPRVAAAVDRSHAVMGELQKATLAHIFAMRQLLRPNQTAQFDQAAAGQQVDADPDQGQRDQHADEAGVARGHVAHPVAEHLGIGGLGTRRRLDALTGIELAGAVIKNRICLSQLVTLTFLGDDMQELRAVEVLQVLQRGN